MHDAELTDGDHHDLIGWVQVGVSRGDVVPGSEAWPPHPTVWVRSRCLDCN